MNKLIIHHGSQQIIKMPTYGLGKPYNDYGQGFYCTEHMELAKEWACSEDVDGYVTSYGLDLNSLNILNLSSDEFTILNWLALLIDNRKIRYTSPVAKRGHDWLHAHFSPDTSNADIIIGYRADDSYFSFARAFLNNEISLKQLNFAMKLGNLGEQVVLKSPKAFQHIQFDSYISVDASEYYIKRKIRDSHARTRYFQELEKDDVDGLYLRDLIREEVLPNDPRLR